VKSELVYAVGFSLWKRRYVRAFLHQRDIFFVSNPARLPKNKPINVAVWGMRWAGGELPAEAKVLRLEDGFIRSVGLGADLVGPLSWVCDDQGIYYNPKAPSRLERILKETNFSTDMLQRAEKLREILTSSGITKYNVGSGFWKRIDASKKVILVPGQVESDASIAYGASNVRTNLELLKEVRRRNPDAFLIYKPHPDVVARLRMSGNGEDRVAEYCDIELRDVAMAKLLDEIDEVHTMTSLTGFEALLRGKQVVTYGMPFYAGWGVTEDIGMSPEVATRRGRCLGLSELIAGTLILYPTYISRKAAGIITPEDAVAELKEWQNKRVCPLDVLRFALRWFLSLRRY
jgi:capsular polysaccharide export protein